MVVWVLVLVPAGNLGSRGGRVGPNASPCRTLGPMVVVWVLVLVLAGNLWTNGGFVG